MGSGYCRLQMPLKLARAVRGTVAGHRLGALEWGGGYLPPVFGVTVSPAIRLCPPPTALQALCTRRTSPPNRCADRRYPPSEPLLENPFWGPLPLQCIPDPPLAPVRCHGGRLSTVGLG